MKNKKRLFFIGILGGGLLTGCSSQTSLTAIQTISPQQGLQEIGIQEISFSGKRDYAITTEGKVIPFEKFPIQGEEGWISDIGLEYEENNNRMFGHLNYALSAEIEVWSRHDGVERYTVEEDNNVWKHYEDEAKPAEVFIESIQAVSSRTNNMIFLDSKSNLWGLGRTMNWCIFGIPKGEHECEDLEEPTIIMEDVKKFISRDSNTIALKNDGVVVGTGHSLGLFLGQSNSIVQEFKPIVKDIVDIAGGSDHFLALNKKGQVLLIGGTSIEHGEAGIDITPGNHPHKPVVVAEDVVQIFACGSNSFIIKKDGSLWATGDNSYGQITEDTVSWVKEWTHIEDNVKTIIVDDVLAMWKDANYGIRRDVDFYLIIKEDGTIIEKGNGTDTEYDIE